jgi:O-antigen ligase
VLVFKIQGSNWGKRTTWIIFLSLCVLMILQNTGFNIKEILNISLFNCAVGAWNEKHHTFWLVILLWPSIYFIKDSSKYNKIITILFFLFALFSSYSESAKVAIIFSIIVFLLSKFRPVVSWAIVYWALLLYILLFPFVLQILPIADLDSVYDRLYIRFLLWEVASNVIVDELIFGRGFGSTLSLNIVPFLPEFHSSAREWLYLSKTFPGNHPHNFVALIWIEFGLVGALMLTFFLYRFNRFITNTIKHSDAAPYIISIITTVVILFSCSWSIWQTDVVLTYIMFLACLNFLISSGKSNERKFI